MENHTLNQNSLRLQEILIETVMKYNAHFRGFKPIPLKSEGKRYINLKLYVSDIDVDQVISMNLCLARDLAQLDYLKGDQCSLKDHIEFILEDMTTFCVLNNYLENEAHSVIVPIFLLYEKGII